VTALTVLVVIFVGIGLAVVFTAMSRGGQGARSRGRTRSRRSRGVLLATGLVAIVFGVALPVLVGSVNANTQSKNAPGGVDLTASQQEGRQLFARNCSNCHRLAAANGVGRVGPNLDQLIPQLPDQEAKVAFILDAINNGRARGQGQMPAEVVDGQDAEDVADFVATVAGR
jgi:mono/diheme cytochrome c family protein